MLDLKNVRKIETKLDILLCFGCINKVKKVIEVLLQYLRRFEVYLDINNFCYCLLTVETTLLGKIDEKVSTVLCSKASGFHIKALQHALKYFLFTAHRKIFFNYCIKFVFSNRRPNRILYLKTKPILNLIRQIL